MDSEVITALIGAAVTVGNVAFTTLMNNRKKQNERQTHLENGVQSLLRAEIIRANEKYSEQGFCPYYAKESLTKAYSAYHALGGNDVATELYHTCMNLPEKGGEEKLQ